MVAALYQSRLLAATTVVFLIAEASSFALFTFRPLRATCFVAMPFVSADPAVINSLSRASTTEPKSAAATASAVTEVALRDFSAGAAGYFSSIRSPASFLAGSSLASLFLFQDRYENERHTSRAERFVLNSYHGLMLLAYSLALSTIVISTAAGVTIMYGKFDPMAESVYMLLRRELTFEFVSARLGFLLSLLCFLAGVSNRAILTFDLLKGERKDWLLFLTFGNLALVTHLLCYVNQTLYCYNNLFAMSIALIKMIGKRVLIEKRPLGLVSMVSFFCAILFGTKSLLVLPEGKEPPVDKTMSTE